MKNEKDSSTEVAEYALDITHAAIRTKRTTDSSGNGWVTARWANDKFRRFGKASARHSWEYRRQEADGKRCDAGKANHLAAAIKLADGYTAERNAAEINPLGKDGFRLGTGFYRVVSCLDDSNAGYLWGMDWVYHSEWEFMAAEARRIKEEGEG